MQDEFIIKHKLSRLTTPIIWKPVICPHEQTRYIFEINTISTENEVLNIDDVIETANRFRCIDMIIDNAKASLT